VSQQDNIRSFIVSELSFTGKPQDLTDDYPLLESEVVDSLGILKLVTFLETNMNIDIDDEDLIPDHFATIADIVNLVEAKKSA